MEEVSRSRSFGGHQLVCSHDSEVLGCSMRFGVYLPPAAEHGPCPVVWFLSGLTCTEQNFLTKAGSQRHAAEHGVIVVAPDTSPRGEGVPDVDAWDLGTGAGFYLDATEAPWSEHYRMESYVTDELPRLVAEQFDVTDRASILGHSMGGHGALTLALRHPGRYRAVSALSPIVAPTQVPWGHKAFSAYLGEDRERWKVHDAVELLKDADERLPLLVDQGLADPFLEEQLQPERLERVCAEVGHPLTLRRHEGYDHGYYFVATFLQDHFAHHGAALRD